MMNKSSIMSIKKFIKSLWSTDFKLNKIVANFELVTTASEL